jgi:hypothetical protein
MNLRGSFAAALALALAAPASAVLIDSGDGTGNVPPFAEPLLAYAGTRGGLSAVYLGDGAVLTANHVGPGGVVIGATSYPWVPGSAVQLTNGDGTSADLLLFAIYPHPGLPPLPIASATPPSGTLLLTVGNGRNRGDVTSWDPNGTYPPGLTFGYAWAPGTALRWGSNFAEVFPPGRVLGTEVFGSVFDSGTGDDEAQAVPGDSGGAVFAWDPMDDYRLAGVIIAISQYGDQPAQTTFYGQTSYYADLAYYREDILDAIALPEPIGGLWPAAALVAALSRSRRVSRSSRRTCAGARRRR